MVMMMVVQFVAAFSYFQVMFKFIRNLDPVSIY